MEKLVFLSVLVLVPFCSGDYTEHCHNLLCPEYTVNETNQAFQKRDYVATQWVSVKLDGSGISDLKAASNKLKEFWATQEEAGKKIPDTWPVLITRTGPEDAPVYTLSWFLPPGFAPQVSDTSVFVENRNPSTVYVKAFGGSPDPETCKTHEEDLKNTLTGAGIIFNPQTSVGAFYDSVWSFTHHNEVWLYGV